MKSLTRFSAGLALFGLMLSNPTGAGGSTAVAIQNEGWSESAPMPTARKGAAGAVLNGKFYVVGGDRGCPDTVSAVESYDAATNAWSTGGSLPVGLTGHAAAVVAGNLYVVGGFPGCAGVSGNLYLYNQVTQSWTAKAPMPTMRSGLAVAVVDGRIYAIGGANAAGSALTVVEVYDPNTDAWTTAAFMSTARTGLSVGVVNNRIYAAGGFNAAVLNHVEMYDPMTNTWVSKAALPVGLHAASAATMGGYLYLFGGQNGTGYINSVFAYDAATDAWASLSPMSTRFAGATAATVNGRLYVAGGISEDGIRNLLHSFSPPPGGGGTGGRLKINCMGDVDLIATGQQDGITFAYPPPTVTLPEGCTLTSISCSRASGSMFPVGTTVVSCTATDSCGNQDTCSFTVRIRSPKDAVQPLIDHVNDLVSSATLTIAQGATLTGQLHSSITLFEQGDTSGGCAMMASFATQVQSFVDASVLSAAQAQVMINMAIGIRSELHC